MPTESEWVEMLSRLIPKKTAEAQFRIIQEEHGGERVWIPRKTRITKQKNIYQSHLSGLTVGEIVDKFGISRTHVMNSIEREAKKWEC